MQKFLNPEHAPKEIAPAQYLVRTAGPQGLQWSGVGPFSIGVVNLPLNEAIKIPSVVVRGPSAEGQSKVSGSKAPNIKMETKTPTQVFSDVRREFPSFGWRMFETREEALVFIATGKDYWETLGIDPGSSAEVARQAYYDLSRIHHPDKGGDVEIFKNITAAYRRITDVE